MEQWTAQTKKIIETHNRDFNSTTYAANIAKYGGYDKYVESLGGVFAEIHGATAKVRTCAEFRKVAEYVFGLMAIWGFDYNNGSTYWHWESGSTGKPSANAFYQTGTGKVNSGTIDQLCRGDNGRGRTTNCNYGVDTLMRAAGLFYDGGPWWSCNYKNMVKTAGGRVIRDKAKLKPGDLVHMFKKAITSDDPEKWDASDWRHVAVVLDVIGDDVVLGDFGSRFIRTGNPRHVMKRTGAGIGPEYDDNYKGWAAVRCCDLLEDIPMLNGIDISSFQKGIDLKKVQGDFVIVKATQGYWYKNPCFEEQIKSADAAGKLLGIYHYGEGTGAAAEADYFIKACGSYIGRAVLAIDWERNQNALFGTASSVPYVKEFVTRVHDKTGVWPLLYCQQSEVLARDWSPVAKTCGLWLAQYVISTWSGYNQTFSHGRTGVWEYPAIWQYTSGGQLAGWSGRLDLNVAYMTAAAWKAYAKSDKKEGGDDIVPRTIKKGSTGKAVKIWQEILGNVTVDGKFGAKTEAATKDWQRKHKDVDGVQLKDDGVVARKTWGAGLKSV